MLINEYREERKLKAYRLILRKLISLIMPFVFGYRLRIRLYKIMVVNINDDHEVYIGRECFIDDEFPELITVKKGACISFRVTIVAHDSYKGIVKPVIIGEKAFIGTGSIILPGVSIGEGSVVAAGSVVNRDVPPKTMAAGVPNKIIKTLP